MLTIWIIPFPVMVFSDFPVLVNEKSNLQIRIGYFAFLPSLDISGNPTKKQGKPKLNPTWIFDFFSSGGKFFDLYMCRHPRALKSLAKITDTKPVFFRKRDLSGQPSNVCHYSRGEGRDTFFQSSSVFRVSQPARLEMLEKSAIPSQSL